MLQTGKGFMTIPMQYEMQCIQCGLKINSREKYPREEFEFDASEIEIRWE